MKRKLNILILHPGIVEIPPKGWGAVEKVIWNYKIQLEKLGHEVDIDVPWDFKKDYDIYHSHTANQGFDDLYLAKKPYIYSLHDHHSYLWGKKSLCYKENLKAMKRSIISISHAEYLIDYFNDTDKLFYLPHGVDTELYVDKNYQKNGHKLLCVASNGLLFNETNDRKGFRYAIESAKELDLPITIVGPESNDTYFDSNKDLLEYDKLEIIKSPTEEELIEIYNQHTIFLHLSDLEAGHPNLTLLESLSCGLPIVGTYSGVDELGGLVKTKRHTDDVVNKLKFAIENYDSLKKETLITSKKYDWSVIVKKLEQIYFNVIDIKTNFTSETMRNKIIDIYDNSEIIYKEPVEKDIEIKIDYHSGPKVSITSPLKDVKYKVDYIDGDKDELVYSLDMSNDQWSIANRKWYTNWIIKITDLNNGNISSVDFDLKYKDVFIKLDTNSTEYCYSWSESVEKFRKKHNCLIYCCTKHNDLLEKEYPHINFVDEGFDDNDIYAKYIIGYSDDRNINPYGNTGIDIAANVLGVK